jgi:VanZ family protein
MSRTRWWGFAISLASVALIGVATLTGSSDTTPQPWCLRCALASEGFAADLIVNVLLFVPLGVGLRLAGARAATAAAVGFLVSLFVELTQAYVVAGRVANVFDLATNTLGTALAAGVTTRWRPMILPTANGARSLSIASTCVVVLILGLTAWALKPAVPRGALVACGVGSSSVSTRAERVVTASVDGMAVRPGDTLQASGVHEGPVQLEVALQASRLPWRTEPAFMLVSDGETFVQLGIDGSDLELEVRRRGEAARFRSPSVRVRRPVRRSNTPEVAQLDTLLLRGVADQWSMSLAVRAPTAHDSLVVRVHPIAGWSLFLNAPRSAWLSEVLTALWTAALIFPVAFWSAWTADGRLQRSMVLPPFVVVAAIWGAAALVGAPAAPLSAVLGAGVAVLGAWGTQRLIKASAR